MRTYIPILLLVCTNPMLAQKEDYIWPVSHTCGLLASSQIDFNTSPATVSGIDRQMCLGLTNTSICDPDGNLLLYTNGQYVANHNDQQLENGDSLNFGFWYTNDGDYGYNVPQGAFFIRRPGGGNTYYLFHMFVDLVGGTIPLSPRYSVIDMDANNGQGKVVEKNVGMLAADATLNFLQATAVRHANGRDWWVLVPNHMGPQYYRFLLTPGGLEGPWVQEIGFRQATSDFSANGFGQRVFSPDGSRFADYDFDNFTQVFDFDRCTGLLANARLLEHTIDPSLNNGGASVAFSPSGRYLYITAVDNGHTLFQYDTEAADLLASQEVIYHCPLVNQQFECGLVNMRLAPDGRIYVSGSVDTISWSIIHQPDSPGTGCGFELGGLLFPVAYPRSYFPYSPNYRLGALPGSGCDTILSGVGVVEGKMASLRLWPNPAGRLGCTASCVLPMGVDGELSVLDPMGIKVENHVLEDGEHDVPLAGLSPGLYFVLLSGGGRILEAQRLFVE